jgi:hypothetical protein
LRLPEHGFCFLSVLDALGNLERKNPVGVIRAYLAAFPRPGAEVFLVLKIRNLDERNLQVLRRMIGPRSDVLLLSGTMSQAALGSLVAACDAYVSLHRAEGFGLTIAEAMAAGKPVLATHYSANTEFMPPGTGYPVPFRLVALDQDSGYFRKGSRWADPDLAEATRLMRWLVGNQDAGRQTGARAAAQVRQALSPAAIGRRMRERLELLDREGRLSKRGARRSDTFAPDRKATGTLGIASIPAKAGPTPRVLVLTPMKNTAAHLDRYQRLLEALDYPREALSLAILEGDSTDDTWSNLVSMQDRLENRFSRVSLHRHDDGFRLSGPRWAPAVQRQRRAVIARARNRLLSLGLGDEAWVLWLDADLLHYPPHLLRSMLAAGKEIVVPHCLREGGGTFDRNTFIFAPNQAAAEHPEDLIDGIFQPPAGRGRVYLDRFRGRPLVEVDGVGGTALLVKADLHREGLVFPAWPHRGYIETEGLAMLARDLGIRCWGMPDLEIVHVRD